MNRRKLALAVIAADVAENGKCTKIGLRAYVEGRVSYQSFQTAMRAGLAIYRRKLETAQA